MTRARPLLNLTTRQLKKSSRFFSHLIYKHPEISEADEPFIQKSKFTPFDTPLSNLHSFTFKHMWKWSDKVALECGVTGRQYTYQEARTMAERFRSSLYNFGAQHGDMLCLALPNVPEYPLLLLGASNGGISVTTMNPHFQKNDIVRQLHNSEAKYVVTTKCFLPKFIQACKEHSKDVKVQKFIILDSEDIKDDDCISFKKLLKSDTMYGAHVGNVNVFKDIALMPYSSRPFGPPKAACFTHENLIKSIDQLTDHELILHPNEQEGTTIAALPFYHMHTLSSVLLYGLYVGAKIVTLPQFEPDSYRRCLLKHQPSWLTLVPYLVNWLASDTKIKAEDVPNLKLITSYGAAIGATVTSKLDEKFQSQHIDFREGYGLTESSTLSLLQPRLNYYHGSCGVPLANTWAKIIDVESGEPVGSHQAGELCIAGPQIMTEYYKNPKATDKALKDGWLHTGDLAYYNSNGHFFMIDKIKDMITVKDAKVSPSGLEDVILNHPGVKEVAVIGVYNSRYGELPRAYVVKDEHYNGKVTEEIIFDQVKRSKYSSSSEHLHGGVVFVDELPKCGNQKVLKKVLKAKCITTEASFSC